MILLCLSAMNGKSNLSHSFLLVPKFGVNVRGQLEEGAGTSRKEILVYFQRWDAWIEVDMFFLDSRFLLDGHVHERPE